MSILKSRHNTNSISINYILLLLYKINYDKILLEITKGRGEKKRDCRVVIHVIAMVGSIL